VSREPRCVLILVQNMSFTYDTRVQNIARTLGRSGYRVRVLCPRYPGDPRSAVVDGIHVRFVRWPELGAGLVAHLLEYLCSVLALSAHAIRDVLRERVEVVHICNPPDLFFGLAALLRLTGKAVVFDQHDSWPELFAAHGNGPLLAGIAGLCTRASLAVAHQTLVTSESAIPAALSRGADPEAIVVVRNGVDLERMPPPAPDDRRLVGYLGNMNPQDGLTELLETIRCIRHDHGRTDIRFLLVGDGTLLPALRQRVCALGLEQLVTFTGRLSPREAWATLARCAVCVQPDPPNVFTHISTMVKSLEYMALGKPIAAFGLVETRRVCGDAALYAPDADPRSLAGCVLTLLDDRRRRAELGARGRRRVEGSFAWVCSEPALLEAYARLPLNRRGRARGPGRPAPRAAPGRQP